jgi:superfamily II DNA or RNA helicase
MNDIIIHKLDEVYMQIECSEAIIDHIRDSFSFYASNYKYHPKFKARLWDGKIRLFNPFNRSMYLGLAGALIRFCKENDYSFHFTFSKTVFFQKQILEEVINEIDGNEVQSLWQHQEEAVNFALETNRAVIVSATAGGKSLIMYVIAMYYLKTEYCKKVLIITPRTSLCEQTKKEFVKYYGPDKKQLSENIGLLYSGSKLRDGVIVMATWQSLKNVSNSYLETFDLVLVDECHGASVTSKELTTIMQKLVNASFRFGFTATTSNDDNKAVNELLLQGLFGPIKNVLSNRQGTERGILAKSIVHAIKLKYAEKQDCDLVLRGSKELQKKYEKSGNYTNFRKQLYIDETNFICQHQQRNNFIYDLAIQCQGNVLIFFNFIEGHGKILEELFNRRSKDSGKVVYYISGEISVSERERIRADIEKNDNLIIIASLGTTSTGINAKNLKNLIFANTGKSFKTTKQSIGRVLRSLEGKELVNIYDIGDYFGTFKGKSGFLYKHFQERIGYYLQEGIEVKGVELQINNQGIDAKEKQLLC